MPATPEPNAIAEYIQKNLKLDIISKRIHPQDSKFNVTIELKLAGNPISAVTFTI
jgi:hypothetical protein